jgi:hypothetical protein
MAAHEHLGVQFMRPGEIMKNFAPATMDYDLIAAKDDHEKFWDIKRHRAVSSGLVDNIAEHGVREPIVLDEGEIYEGHHRTVSGAEIERRTGKPFFVPVRQFDPERD